MAKVLVVKLAAIGDVVLSLAALDAIRDEDPGVDLTLLVGNVCAPVAEQHPAIRRHWVIDENIFWKKRLLSLIKLAWQVRSERFDRVYILHWSPLFNYFFQAAGIRERWGFARDGDSRALTRQVPYREGDPNAHDVAQYLHAVSDRYPVSGRPARLPRIYFTTDEERAAGARIGQATLPIAIAPGGGNNPKLFMPQKRWLTQGFTVLASRLIQQHGATLFIAGDRTERGLLEPLATRFPDRVHLMAGKLSLRETVAVIQHCKLFIGNDSGLLHVSGAVGTPSVSFFGPTSPHGKLPVWLAHEVLYTQETCSPCYKHGYAPPCPYDLQCMRRITLDDAYAAVMRVLQKAS